MFDQVFPQVRSVALAKYAFGNTDIAARTVFIVKSVATHDGVT